MTAKSPFRFVFFAAALLACNLLVDGARAQQPSASAVNTAKELILLKGGAAMFDPVVAGVVEQTKGALLQTNPQLAKDLTDVGSQLRTEFGPRRDELIVQAAKFYATRFSEAELKEIITFYKTPAGAKMLQQEPLALDETLNYADQWGRRISEEVMNRFRAEMKKKGHNL